MYDRGGGAQAATAQAINTDSSSSTYRANLALGVVPQVQIERPETRKARMMNP